MANWPGLVGLMLVRLGLLLGLLILLSVFLPGDNIAFYAFMALAYIVSIPYALWSRNSARLTRMVPLQFVVDLIVVTGVVYFTGGIDSDLTLLYPLVILSAGIVTSPRHAIEITILCSLAYATLVLLLQQGVLVAYGAGDRAADWGEAARTVGVRLLIFACFGGTSAFVSQRCQFLDRNISLFREMAELVLRNVRTGLMLLDENGRILMVNEVACRLLGQKEENLIGLPVVSLVGEGALLNGTNAGGEDESPCFFRRPDGSMFPVSVEMSRLTMPAEVVPGRKGRRGNIGVSIAVFSDISRIMEMKEKVARADRARAAVRLAAEIAHEIRNPLAAVSGAAQQLESLERKAMLGDAQSADVLREERRRIFDIIVSESTRLDRTIEQFINSADCAPEAIQVRLGDEGKSLAPRM